MERVSYAKRVQVVERDSYASRVEVGVSTFEPRHSTLTGRVKPRYSVPMSYRTVGLVRYL